jgi:uncharacterized protein (UPF0335 family)
MQAQARARSDRAALKSAKALDPVVVSQSGKRPEMTVSFNGGPEVPFNGAGSVMAAVALADGRDPHLARALKVLEGQQAREAAAGQPQRDLEEATGVAPRQQAREAEAGGIAGDRLRSIVDRIERLEEERKALASDIKDIFSEAKSAGFDVKAVRQVIRMRKWEPAELEAHEALIELYRRALGM